MRAPRNRTVRDVAEQIRLWVSVPRETAPNATLLLRLMAGSVFVWEGILKFVYVNQGVGRFTKLGMPLPAATAHFVGGLEIVGGALLLLGLATRLIAIPFMCSPRRSHFSLGPRPCRSPRRRPQPASGRCCTRCAPSGRSSLSAHSFSARERGLSLSTRCWQKVTSGAGLLNRSRPLPEDRAQGSVERAGDELRVLGEKRALAGAAAATWRMGTRR